MRNTLIWGGLFLLVLVLSILIFLFRQDPRVQRVLFFPRETAEQWDGEFRRIFEKHDLEEAVTELLKEAILGPMQIRHGRLLPRNVRIRSLVVREGTVYLDFSDDLFFPEGEVAISLQEMMSGVKKAIRFNFPEIERINVFIGGQLFEAPAGGS